jgi:hypothetical protein
MAFNPFGYSNAQSKPFTEDPEYAKWRYDYNGDPAGAAKAQANLYNREAAVEERTAPQMQGAQMQGAQLDQGPANQTRDIQMGSLAGLQAAASGNAPSAAENLARQGIDRSLRAQTSAAGNVRGGPGASASAYRYASQGAAQQRADMNQGIQAERANELATARGQLATAGTAVRGQDLTAATSNAQLLQDTNKTNANLLQDTNKTNAQLNLQGRALNDERAQQYEQLQNKVATDQLNANVQQQQIAAGVRENADRLNTATNQKNADRTWDVTKVRTPIERGTSPKVPWALHRAHSAGSQGRYRTRSRTRTRSCPSWARLPSSGSADARPRTASAAAPSSIRAAASATTRCSKRVPVSPARSPSRAWSAAGASPADTFRRARMAPAPARVAG